MSTALIVLLVGSALIASCLLAHAIGRIIRLRDAADRDPS